MGTYALLVYTFNLRSLKRRLQLRKSFTTYSNFREVSTCYIKIMVTLTII